MLVLGIDFEATGICPLTSRPTELGAILWDTEAKQPLQIFHDFMWASDYPIPAPENIAITGLTSDILKKYGEHPASVFKRIEDFCIRHDVKYLVAHNATNYDKILLKSECDQWENYTFAHLLGMPWIDTRVDLPYEIQPDSMKLKHLSTDAGFINPFPHRAIFDTAAMLKLMAQFDFKAILDYKDIPSIVIRADVSYDHRQLAKDRRFMWEKIGDKVYPKAWVKSIKANKLEVELALCPFPIIKLE